MSENHQNPEEAILGEVESIFTAMTPEKMIDNDIDLAKSSRDLRKISQAALMAALSITAGRSGLTKAEKVELLQASRDRALLAVKALNKAIDKICSDAKEEN